MMLDALAPEFRPEHAGLSPADVNELEEVDLCNETLARLELLEQEDSITRGLYELMAQDYLAATGELADPPRLTTLSLAPALDYDSASPPQSPRSTYRSMPFSEARRQGEAPHAQGVRPPPLLNNNRRDPTPFVKSP